MDDRLHDVTVCILVGGESRRMGTPKSSLVINGKPILRDWSDRIGIAGETLLVSAPGKEHPPDFELFSREVADPVAGLGPLRGVLTALENARNEIVVVIPVDMVGIGREQIVWYANKLKQRSENLGVMGWRLDNDDESVEPFPLAIRRGAKDLVTAELSQNRRAVIDLSKNEKFSVVDIPESWPDSVWTNLNSPDDLEAFQNQKGH